MCVFVSVCVSCVCQCAVVPVLRWVSFNLRSNHIVVTHNSEEQDGHDDQKTQFGTKKTKRPWGVEMVMVVQVVVMGAGYTSAENVVVGEAWSQKPNYHMCDA